MTVRQFNDWVQDYWIEIGRGAHALEWSLHAPHQHRPSIVCSTEEMRSTEHLPLQWETT